jgi:CBS domain-containing membrane protein
MSTPAYARDLMTKDVVALEEDQHLGNLEASMRALRFRHMPVIEGKKLIGLVSERDLLRTAGSSLLPHKKKQDQFINDHFRVADIMARDVATVPPDAALVDVAVQMRARKLGCMPVVDGSGNLLGIITEADFVRLAGQLLARP